MTTIDLPQGTVAYRSFGPAGSSSSSVVFVHAFLADGSVWTRVAEMLAEQGICSYAPDWPLGAHRHPMNADADQSPRGVARLILAFLDALDLRDVTLVGSDTGGALCQYILDTDTRRIGRVVLTNSDAFDSFPPFPFNVMFGLLKGRRRMALNLQPMRLTAIRHSPFGLGLLARRLDPDQTRRWIEPGLRDSAIRADAVQFLRAAEPSDLKEVSARMSQVDLPVRLVWGMSDRSFRPSLGRRLQAAFGHADFVEVAGARTLVQLDAPEVLAREIADLAGDAQKPAA